MNQFYRHDVNLAQVPTKPHAKDMTPSSLVIGQVQLLEQYMDVSFPYRHNELPTRDRLQSAYCDCNGNGQFVMLAPRHKSVLEGGKNYCTCNVCGLFSHI